MRDKIKKFPISYSQRRKNTLGALVVECQISDRYLQFHEKSCDLQGGEFLTVDVMKAQDEDNKLSRKICELIITREDLLEALKHISPQE